jgi:hypothetical protein
MRPLHDFFASSHADDRADAAPEPAMPENRDAAPDTPVPPIGTAHPASLVAAAAEGKRGSAWRLFHWIEQDHPEAIEAIRNCSDRRLWELLLEWLALGTWAGKPFHAPPPMRQPHFYTQIRTLFLLDVRARWLVDQVLSAALHDPRPQVREHAAHLFGMLGEPAAIPELIEALRDAAPGVRVQAAGALGRMRATQAAPALVAALSYHDEALASQIRQALLHFGSPATPPLVKAARLPDAWVRWHALRILSELHDARGVPVLIERLADDNLAVAWMAARGLVAMGAPMVEDVLRLLVRAPDTPWLMETAAYVLRARRDEPLRSLLAPVIRCMHSAAYRVEVPLAVKRALEQLEGNSASAK